MSDETIGPALVAISIMGILFLAVLGPVQCSDRNDTIKRLTEKQCGQIDGRKEYAKCVEEFLK